MNFVEYSLYFYTKGEQYYYINILLLLQKNLTISYTTYPSNISPIMSLFKYKSILHIIFPIINILANNVSVPHSVIVNKQNSLAMKIIKLIIAYLIFDLFLSKIIL